MFNMFNTVYSHYTRVITLILKIMISYKAQYTPYKLTETKLVVYSYKCNWLSNRFKKMI